MFFLPLQELVKRNINSFPYMGSVFTPQDLPPNLPFSFISSMIYVLRSTKNNVDLYCYFKKVYLSNPKRQVCV